MRWLGGKIASFVWWTYPRGSLEYDIMVGVILAFIFLTPAAIFHDQPQPASPPPAIHSPLERHHRRLQPAPGAVQLQAPLAPGSRLRRRVNG